MEGVYEKELREFSGFFDIFLIGIPIVWMFSTHGHFREIHSTTSGTEHRN
jgi:hypothetical protein